MTLRSALVRLPVLVLLLGPALGACVHTFWQTRPRAVDVSGGGDTSTFVRAPLKVHLSDGGTVIFREGAWIDSSAIRGTGEAYGFLGNTATRRTIVPLDSVLGVEAFEGKLLQAQSVAVSLAATAVTVVGTLGLLKAMFGSCPTLYAESDSGPVLLAEGFSYAIAPLLEHRDLDPLDVRPRADGSLRLELRNEALETHFVNSAELVAVRHATGERVVPDQHGKPVVLSGMRPLARAVDRAGRDVILRLAKADGRLFASDDGTVAAADEADLDDWIDIEADDLAPGDSVAVVLRLRNSLLNTVLLYDVILGGRDAPQWLAVGMQHIATALDLSAWYVQSMGMRVTVEGLVSDDDAGGKPHARLGDVGPLAFREVAIVLPRPTPDARTVRMRLRFTADNWRIDEARVAAVISRPVSRIVPLSRVTVPTPAQGIGATVDTAALRSLREVDNEYLETRPGQRMILEFAGAADPPAADSATSYLIGWQGWYREWIRGEWLARPTRTTPFVPGNAAVATALARWRERAPELEHAFYTSRIPVQ